MNRRPERAPLIVAVALLGWALVVVTTAVLRRTADVDHRRARLQRFVSLMASQTLIGQALAFPLPFFALASSWPPPWLHVPFALTYVIAVVVTAWDPFFERVAARLPLLLALQAFAAGAALLTVLPMLGLSNTWTFLATGLVVGVGLPVGVLVLSDRTARAIVIGIVAAVACAVMVYLGAPLVPPAPLRLQGGVMATHVSNREPVGVARRFPSTTPQLLCHTAIAAPLGLKDALTHVWSRDGVVVQRVDLDVSGTGRAFRTWSRLSRPRPGHYRCRIETRRGQVVGEVRAVVE
jgi:MFS family permease